MKKKKLLFLLLTFLISTETSNDFCLMSKNPIGPKYVLVKPGAGSGGGAPLPNGNDFNAKNAPNTKREAYYNNVVNDTFGTAIIQNDSTQYDEESKKTFRSNWTNTDYFENFPSKIYETYKFSKLVDIPVKTLITRKLSAGESSKAIIQATQSTSERKSITSEFASSYYGERCSDYGLNTGMKLSIDDLKLSGSFYYNENYKIGGSVSSNLKRTKENTTTYGALYEETIEIDNSDSSVPTYFAFNFRQKFEIYFTTAFSYVYTEETWNSGMFNWDVHYDYTFHHYVGVSTAFYLLPIENPYFEISKYQDNAYGHQKIIKLDGNENIVYL